MKTSITVILVLGLLPSLTSAVTIRVPMDQPTIEAGMEAAAHGDTVEVACGTYYEHGIALKGGVLLRSETGQADCVTIDGQFLEPVMRLDAPQEFPRFNLEGLTVTRGDSAGFWVDSFYRMEFWDFAILECEFVNNQGPGMKLGRGTDSGTVSNCSFSNNSEEGVLSFGNGNKFFSNCDFIGNGGGGLIVEDIHGHFEISHCSIKDNGGIGASAEGGGGNFFDVFSCQISGNGSGGIWAGTPDLVATILDSEISENEGDGIYFRGTGMGRTIGNCVIRENTGHGIMFGSADEPAETMDKLFGMKVFNCKIAGNEKNGIYFGPRHRVRYLAVESCLIVQNGLDGIGMYTNCYLSGADCSIRIYDSTIAANEQFGLVAGSDMHSEVEYSIIAFNQAEAVHVTAGVVPRMLSTNIYGNLGGDWIGDIAPQIDAPGNFWADPCFCTPNFMLAADSPCLPENHPWEWNTQVGALGMGCGGGMCNGPIAIENSSWGTVKALYH